MAAIMIVGAAFNTSALPPSKTGEYQSINSAKEAKALPGQSQLMLACSGCKTIRPLNRKGIMAWFSTKVQHDCPACGGKLKFTGASGKVGWIPDDLCAHLLALRQCVGLCVRQSLSICINKFPKSGVTQLRLRLVARIVDAGFCDSFRKSFRHLL